MEIRFILLSLILLYVGLSNQDSSKCNTEIQCNGIADEKRIEEFCLNHTGTYTGRCCYNESVLIGLDLSNCSISTLHNILSNFTSLQFLDLIFNPIEECSKEDFQELKELEYLYLPRNCSCPGNNTAWLIADHTHNITECFGQQNPCQYLNVSCTDSGYCLHTGPGSAKCDCLPDHYGYRCLRKGEFPYKVFISLIATLTALFSASLWCFLRRHVKTD